MAASAGGAVPASAAGPEREIDDLGRPEREGVGAGAVSVGDEDDVTGGVVVRARVDEWLEQSRDGLGGHEREVDREHEDRLGAAGDHVGACLGEAGIEALGPLAEGPGADLGRLGQHLGVGADDQDVVEPGDGQGARDGPCQQVLDEVMPLLGVERVGEPGLGALEGADWDDHGDPHGRAPAGSGNVPAGSSRVGASAANSSTSPARRARPG